MKWVNFLHLYQPPNQTKDILDVVTSESYRLIIKLLDRFPRLYLTINISGSLLELFEKNGHGDLIKSFVKYHEMKRIELVGSAMYHPVLPLIPESEIKEQVELNTQILKKHFGDNIILKGFYLPEMAYSERVGMIIKRIGFEWIILDEIHAGGKVLSSNIKYFIKKIGINVIFRNNKISKNFPPEFIHERQNKIGDGYLVTAHDGELYGHWHKDDKGYYKESFENAHIQFILASEYLQELTEVEEIDPIEASWESTTQELTSGIPFALWADPQNIIHSKLWTLVDNVRLVIEKNCNDQNILDAKRKFHRGLASCAWWWASEKKLGPFSPKSWNPTEIDKGIKELLGSAMALTKSSPEDKIIINELSSDLHDFVWKKHNKEYN